MTHYLKNAGGLDAVIRRFHEFDIGTYAWEFIREEEQPLIDTFYDILGWPRPDYPPDQQVPNRKPLPQR